MSDRISTILEKLIDRIIGEREEVTVENDQLRAELARRDAVIEQLIFDHKIAVAECERLTAELVEKGEYENKLVNTVDFMQTEISRFQEKLHDEMSQLKIATDLGNKRWVALNDIYENGEKHNTNWCKRKAQEGLGIK